MNIRFVVPLLLLLNASVSGGEEAAPPAPKWLSGISRVAYTDLPNIQALGDWPDKFIDDCGKAGVQLLFSRAHSGEGWEGLGWKSRFGAPDPKMKDRDGTREIAEHCHKRGIRYLPYYWAQREPLKFGEEHPELRCVNAKGNRTLYYCMNTAYRDLVRNRIVELVRDLHTDGVFFDMFHARADECYCDACKAKFKQQTGLGPPLKEDFDSLVWQQWVNFKYRSLEEAMLDFNRAIKAANPEAALMVNSWNAWVIRNSHNTRNSIRVAEVVDAMLEEVGWYDTVDPSFFAFPAHQNFMNWHLAGLCKDKRAFMWSSPSYMRTQPLRYTEAMIRSMNMMTNGAVPAQSVPGRGVMAKYMADIAQRESCFTNDRLYPWCGLVVSEKTELWYGRDDPKSRYLKGIYGAYQAMLEQHLPISLVTDRELERGRLDSLKVLFLPNCAAMSEAELETVRNFVKAGGGLVATYETSFYDEHAKPREAPGFADLFQAKKTGEFDTQRLNMSFDPKTARGATLYLPAQHRWAADPVLKELLTNPSSTEAPGTVKTSFPLHCRMLIAEPVSGALGPMRISTFETDKKTGEVKRTNTPAIFESNYGKGRVIYLPFDLSWAFFRYGHEQWARLMELALREAASTPPPVEVVAPRIVQAMTHQQEGRLVVHLLNDVSSFGRSQNVAAESGYERREVIPIHNITLTFRDKNWKRFRLIPGDVELNAEAVADGMRVAVPRMEAHCLVVAE